MTDSWKTAEYPSIPKECLDCIKDTEVALGNTRVDGCVQHDDWLKKHVSERRVCGPYAISAPYFDMCKEKDFQRQLPANATFEECALHESCARTCVKIYVEVDDSSCGRKDIHFRKCVDFGIIHAQKHGACSSQKSADVINHAAVMQESCEGLDGLSWLDKTTTAETQTGTDPVVIVAPVTSVVLVLGILVGMLVWYFKYYRKGDIAEEDTENKGRQMNMYITGGASGMATNFDYEKCPQDIKEMLETRSIPIQDLQLKEEVGKGQFGVIRKADLYTDSEKQQKILVAVKMIRANQITEDNINDILREAHIMYHFDHPNVLGIIGVVWSKGDPPLVVLPYMGKGSLLELVRKEDAKFSETDLLSFTVQISAGLAYLEKLKFVHRDIALRNCLVSDYFVVKISDFGLSRDVYDTGIYDCEAQTDKKFDIREKRLPWKWLAPECMKEGLFTHKSDVWAFGILIWELYNSGRPPYPAMANLTILQECLESGYRLAKPDNLHTDIYELMRRMWDADPNIRPGLTEIHRELEAQIKGLEADISYDYSFEAENQGMALLRNKFVQPFTGSQELSPYADNAGAIRSNSIYE